MIAWYGCGQFVRFCGLWSRSRLGAARFPGQMVRRSDHLPTIGYRAVLNPIENAITAYRHYGRQCFQHRLIPLVTLATARTKPYTMPSPRQVK